MTNRRIKAPCFDCEVDTLATGGDCVKRQVPARSPTQGSHPTKAARKQIAPAGITSARISGNKRPGVGVRRGGGGTFKIIAPPISPYTTLSTPVHLFAGDDPPDLLGRACAHKVRELMSAFG